MHDVLLAILVDPLTREPLELDPLTAISSGQIGQGKLRNRSGREFAIRNGIPRLVAPTEANQSQTARSFGYKWSRRHSWDSTRVGASAQPWLVKRYGFGDVAEMRRFFESHRTILDAGCGAGLSASLWMEEAWSGRARWVGMDISGAIDVAQERLGHFPNTDFVEGDVMRPPFRHESFDAIFSEGVLHHTPSTERALGALVSLLASGGEFLFYVYRRKGPIREFADDYIRSIVAPLPPDEAWNRLRPLTQLARALAEIKATVDVAEDVSFLEIRAGRYDVQRLIYGSFLKLFWNGEYSFEENNHVNFDWYHPRYAHRQTEEEVRRWCGAVGLSIVHFDVEESGITVRALKD
jgi:arsenite methyltransferase